MKISGNSNFYYRALLAFTLILAPNFSKAEFLTTSTEFTVPANLTMGFNSLFTPYANVNGSSFFVWVDAGFRPQITQKTATGLLTIPLDPNPDYVCNRDSHHSFSLGVDKNGYIHVTGDMHQYPSGGAAWLPLRYQNQASLYWISKKPLDISGGFSFAGAPHDPRGFPAGGITYSRFFHSMTGELYWTALIHAVDDNFEFLTGQMGIALHKYIPGPSTNPSAGTWMALGDYVTPSHLPSNPVPYYKVIFWADAGQYSGVGGAAWFQGYQNMFQFDTANRLHFATAVVPDPTYTGNTRVMYAMSPDGGLTWKKADGTSIPGVPLRGEDSSPNVADVVLDTKNAYTMGDYVAVAPDANGVPSVLTNSSAWRRWDGQKWNSDISNGIHAAGDHGYLGTDGRLTFNESNVIWLHRMTDFNQNASPFQLQSYLEDSSDHFFGWISDLGIYTTGSHYGVALDDNTLKDFQVTKVTFTPGPLPAGWSDQDVGTELNKGGSSDYLNGTFTLRASGFGFGQGNTGPLGAVGTAAPAGTTDQLHYTYTKLSGDGTLIARIASQQFSYYASSEGLMMRETLAEGSTFAMVGLTYQNTAQWMYRTATDAVYTASGSQSISAPSWFKLVRSGNQFTGYQSADGSHWTQQGTTQTITMNQNIYVGLMAYDSNWYNVHQATVDNVSLNGQALPAAPSPTPTPTISITAHAPLSCVLANPVVKLTPVTTSVAAGQNIAYVATTTNMDSAGCGPSNFIISTIIPSGVTSTLLPSTSVFISPGQSSTTQVQLAVGASTPLKSYPVSISSTNYASGKVGSAKVAMNVIAAQACIRGTPTGSMSPLTQSVVPGGSLTYSVSYTNTDSIGCGASNMPLYGHAIPTVSTNVPSGITILSGQTLMVNPGQTVTSAVQIKTSLASSLSTIASTPLDTYTLWVSVGTGLIGGNLIVKAPTPPPAPPVKCITAAPKVTMTPATQTALLGSIVNYTVSTTNMDSAACGQSNFALYTNVIATQFAGSNGINAQIFPQNVTIYPGQTVTSQVQLAVSSTSTPQNYAVWVSSHNNSSGLESLASAELTIASQLQSALAPQRHITYGELLLE